LVLIKLLDSPSLCQFISGCYLQLGCSPRQQGASRLPQRAGAPRSFLPSVSHHSGALPLILGSQLLCRRYKPILPTSLTYFIPGLEVRTLGTCCGLRYGHLSCTQLPGVLSGPHSAPDTAETAVLLHVPSSYLGMTPTLVRWLALMRKENPPQGRKDLVPVSSGFAASRYKRWFRNINLIPFRPRGTGQADPPGIHASAHPGLRTDWPTDKCCSRGTLSRFSLQSSHLNNRYYHQD